MSPVIQHSSESDLTSGCTGPSNPGVRNRSIETNRCQLVNWYRLVSINRWLIDSHMKLPANSIDFHRLAVLIGYWLLSRWKSIRSRRFLSLIYCSLISNINQLIAIDFDFDQLTNSSIVYTGFKYKQTTNYDNKYSKGCYSILLLLIYTGRTCFFVVWCVFSNQIYFRNVCLWMTCKIVNKSSNCVVNFSCPGKIMKSYCVCLYLP